MLKSSEIKPMDLTQAVVGTVVTLYSAGWGRPDSPPYASLAVVVDDSRDHIVVYFPRYLSHYSDGSVSEFGGDTWHMKRKDGYRKGTTASRTNELHIVDPSSVDPQLIADWKERKGQHLVSPYYKAVFNV